MSRFQPIVDEMLEQSRSKPQCWGPRGFRDYCLEHGFSTRNTAYYLSVQDLPQLATELREQDAMVFRLGSVPDGRRTQFIVARLPNTGVECFFFRDEPLFANHPIRRFAPQSAASGLEVFEILGTITEQSALRMAFQAGLISEALQLSDAERIIVPAAGNSEYTFDVRLHPAIPGTFVHRKGQVEIDGLFIAERRGKRTLFVLEAKKSTSLGSLAKHKLAYPIWAVADRVPASIDEIIPVYVRMSQTDTAMRYYLAECSPVEPQTMTVAGLNVDRSTCWELEVDKFR